MVRVTFATAVANIAAPTVAELNAGTALEGFITPDGLNIGMNTGKVNTSNLGSTYTTNFPGRREPDITLTVHHDGTTDTAYNLMVYKAVGFLVCRYGVLKTTAWTIADKVKVYPVAFGEAPEVPPAPDGTWDFTVPVFVTSEPNTRAVVA
jgi:hypothetical protein